MRFGVSVKYEKIRDDQWLISMGKSPYKTHYVWLNDKTEMDKNPNSTKHPEVEKERRKLCDVVCSVALALY